MFTITSGESRTKPKITSLLILAIDIVLINLATLAAFYIRFSGSIPEENFKAYINMLPWLVLGALFLLRVYNLFPTRYYGNWQEVILSIFVFILIYNIGFMAVSYFSREFAFPRTVLAIQYGIQLVSFLAWRRIVWLYHRKNQKKIKFMIIASQEERDYYSSKINLTDTPFIWDAYLDPVSFERQEIKQKLLSEVVNEGYEALLVGRSIPPEFKKEVIDVATNFGLTLFVIPDFYDITLRGATIDQVQDVPILRVDPNQISHKHKELKRLVDLCLSFLLLLVLIVPALIIALAITIEDGFPVLYRQERLTGHGKPFMLYKFRTMIKDAEKETGPVIITGEDPRITKVGRILRSCRLDEIPQLINVIKGEMSLVGPRPERKFFVDQFTETIPGYRLRYNLTSGITGLAQVNGRYSTRPEDKLVMDLIYGQKHSIWFDVKLLLQTIKVVLSKSSSM